MTVINITDYPSPHEFIKSYLMANAKFITQSDVLNTSKGNSYNNYILNIRASGLNEIKFSTLHLKW